MSDIEDRKRNVAVVSMITDLLETKDLVRLNLHVTSGWNPIELPFYETVKPLFTEAAGTKMHPAMESALFIIVRARLKALQ